MTNQTIQTICQLFVAGGLLAAALGGFGAYIFGQRIRAEKEATQQTKERQDEARKAYSGQLENQPKILLSTENNIYPKLEFGDSGSMIVWVGPTDKPIFNIGGDPLTIEIAGEQLIVSATIRNKDGQIVAEIIQNEWKVNPQNSWDRNYTKNALEVRDPSGDIVLQVRLVEDRVQFQAKMYASNKTGIAFVKGPGGGYIERSTPERPFRSIISPIFKYPSDIHFGELIDNPIESQ